MSTRYRQTINTYKHLGKKYLAELGKASATELPEFIRILPREALVLDVGCAGGKDAKKFLVAGCRVFGIDVVPEFLKEAKEQNRRGKFLVMDVRKLSFPRDYFDAIWADSILLHFPKKDVRKIVTSFYGILKAGGKLHIRVKLGRGVRPVADSLGHFHKRWFYFYSPKEIEKICRQAGFLIIASRIFADEWGRKDVKWVSVWGRKPTESADVATGNF